MKKTKTKPDINIFVENIYEEFAPALDLKQMTQDAVEMMRFFLAQKNWLENSCLKNYDFETLCFDVVLTDDEKIHQINRDYREKDRPTDVITFAIFADSDENERFIFDNEINLGEILISLDTAKRQTQENNRLLKDELYFLLAHGTLHLLGYDHTTEETLTEMWEMQNKMLSEIGEINV